MQFTDSHCHLDLDDFKSDLNSVITNAERHGVQRFLVAGIEPKGWHRQILLQNQYPSVLNAFGIHPWFIDEPEIDNWLVALEQVHKQHPAIAVGEIGIDTKINNIELQQWVFEQQIELANTRQLPIVVHHRQSHHLIMQSFARIKPHFGGMIHGFSGSFEAAQGYVKLGFKLGVGGVITYPRANKTQQALKAIGIEHLLLETDSPSMPLNGEQGHRNEPKHVLTVAEQLASLLNLPLESIAQHTERNFNDCFLNL